MPSVRRLGGLVVVAFFVAMTALRPVFRNPAIANTSLGELFQWPQVLLYLPLLALGAVLFVLAALSVLRGDGLPTGSRETFDPDSAGDPADQPDDEQGFWAAEREKESVWEETTTESAARQEGPSERYRDHPAVPNDRSGADEQPLRGIEAEEPDARLSEHLDHLKTELADDDTVREALDTLETVVEETEAGHEIPPRCPREGCGAVWSGRTVLGFGTDRYEVLDDGEEIVCLDCESVYRPQSED
ncbi:hypothetical protein GRX03_03160 [Halovenus sp. WSH3]|uniref:Uncharacterized protein n=1 Tax=Halovenus carboxidivorans TaxID=2692199 RepID=A0A6B0TBN0_9EURY|nr:hypothetical protein [Halovenus carboxidivorans]MXR50609.1 hypothetical protein [Halovenus carboxidivorans]